MPIFNVNVTNSTFCNTCAPQDFNKAEAALKSGIEGAVAIAAEELLAGASNTVVEVCVTDLDNVTVLRSAVSLSVSRLFVN